MNAVTKLGVAMGYVYVLHIALGRLPGFLLESAGGMDALALLGSMVR